MHIRLLCEMSSSARSRTSADYQYCCDPVATSDAYALKLIKMRTKIAVDEAHPAFEPAGPLAKPASSRCGCLFKGRRVDHSASIAEGGKAHGEIGVLGDVVG